MKFIKKIIHSLGFDIVRIPKDFENTFLGLQRYPIYSVIDIGANRGQFAKRVLSAFPNAHIYCFEPLPDAFKELKKWANQQNNKVSVFNLALGDKEGEIKMFLHLNHDDSSSVLETTALSQTIFPFVQKQSSIFVKQITLDKVINNLPHPLTPEIIVKIDVQGYEDKVIQGGRETLNKTKACIIEVCLDHLYKKQATFKNIFLLMDQLDFEYIGNLEQISAKDGHVIYIDAVFSKGRSGL